jgi:hypothetical protein
LRNGDNGDLGRYIQSFQPLNFCLKLSIENMFSSFRQAKRNRNGTQRVLGGWRFPGRFAVSLPGPGNSIWRYLFILFLFCYFLPAVFCVITKNADGFFGLVRFQFQSRLPSNDRNNN